MPNIELGNFASPDSVFGRLADYVTTQVALPMQSFFAGILLVFRHFFVGHAAYHTAYGQFLLGEVKWDGGWWYYFPVALAVKTTLPFLALTLLALLSLWRGRREAGRDGSLFVVWAIVSILVVAMPGSLNIGVRHVLPMYPLMAILASSVFSLNRSGSLPSRLRMTLAGLLLAGHAAASLGAHPDYLAYFNETARGKEHEFLGDSNLDWGQDLARLGTVRSAARNQEHFPELFRAYITGSCRHRQLPAVEYERSAARMGGCQRPASSGNLSGSHRP